MQTKAARAASNRVRRGGYTLSELLIVLAVIATLAAMAWPAMRKPLAKWTLRESAKQLRAELGRVRLEAIEAGETLQVNYLPGTSQYRIASLRAAAAAGQPAGIGEDLLLDTSDQFGPPSQTSSADEAISAVTASSADQTQEPPPRLEMHELPDGVLFADTSIDSLETGQPEMADEQSLEASLPAVAEWSEPIYFYPNGRTSNAVIQLVGEQGYRVRLSIRGVTGTVEVGELERPPRQLNALTDPGTGPAAEPADALPNASASPLASEPRP